jgi:hypothetical protein
MGTAVAPELSVAAAVAAARAAQGDYAAVDHATRLGRNAARSLRDECVRFSELHLTTKKAWLVHEPIGGGRVERARTVWRHRRELVHLVSRWLNR